MKLKVSDYIQYIYNVSEVLYKNKDFITELDSATGDGDHWINLNSGFQQLVKISEELNQNNFSDLFKRIGMVLMSTIGGSSGVLYGGAYLAASKVVGDKNVLDLNDLLRVFEAMLDSIKNRGKSNVGDKTMIDALQPVVDAFSFLLEKNASDDIILEKMAEAAKNGAEKTKEMPAKRGRAYYQKNKGIGHLDPGAVTMSFQIISLCNLMMNKGDS